MGIDKLIDLLVEFSEKLLPFVIINYYDRGVRLRFGKPKGVMEPGFHWKIPFADEILSCMVKPTTLNLTEQSLYTKDGVTVVIRGVLKYEIEDVEKLLLEVNSAQDALSDMSQGLIRDKIIEKTWQECNEAAIIGEVSRSIKSEAKKWGIKVLSFTITDFSKMNSIRLFNK